MRKNEKFFFNRTKYDQLVGCLVANLADFIRVNKHDIRKWNERYGKYNKQA